MMAQPRARALRILSAGFLLAVSVAVLLELGRGGCVEGGRDSGDESQSAPRPVPVPSSLAGATEGTRSPAAPGPEGGQDPLAVDGARVGDSSVPVRVVAAEDGRPLPEAFLQHQTERGQPRTIRLAPQGRAKLDLRQTAGPGIQVTCEGRATVRLTWAEVRRQSRDGELVVALAPLGVLRIQVEDSDADPVAGALVRVAPDRFMDMPPDWPGTATGRTGSAGRFVASGLPAGVALWVEVTEPVMRTVSPARIDPRTGEGEVVVRVERGSRILGTVLEHGGAPAPRRLVVLHCPPSLGQRAMLNAVTDASGGFEFTGVAQGVARLTITGSSADPVVVPIDQTTIVLEPIRLPSLKRVEGRVVTGRPLPPSAVELRFERDGRILRSFFPDEDGRFDLELPQGSILLSVYYHTPPFESVLWSRPVDPPARDLWFDLRDRTAELAVRAEGAAQGGSVQLSKSWSEGGPDDTWSLEGVAEFELALGPAGELVATVLPPGRFDLGLRLDGGSVAFLPGVLLTARERTVLEVGALGVGSIAGTVEQPGGARVPGAVVTARALDGTEWTATTGVDGSFLLESLPPGVVQVVAHHSATGSSRPEAVSVSAGVESHAVLRVHPPGSISGRLLGSPESTSGVEVLLRRAASSRPEAWTRSDGEGRFAFAELEPDRYLVAVNLAADQEGETLTWVQRLVDLREGGPLEVVLDLGTASWKVCVLRDGAPLDRLSSISWVDLRTGARSGSLPDTSGCVQLRPSRGPGWLLVAVTQPPFGGTGHYVIPVAEDEVGKQGTFQVPPHSTIVELAPHTPASAGPSLVLVELPGGQPLRTVLTREIHVPANPLPSGHRRFDGLLPGGLYRLDDGSEPRIFRGEELVGRTIER